MRRTCVHTGGQSDCRLHTCESRRAARALSLPRRANYRRPNGLRSADDTAAVAWSLRCHHGKKKYIRSLFLEAVSQSSSARHLVWSLVSGPLSPIPTLRSSPLVFPLSSRSGSLLRLTSPGLSAPAITCSISFHFLVLLPDQCVQPPYQLLVRFYCRHPPASHCRLAAPSSSCSRRPNRLFPLYRVTPIQVSAPSHSVPNGAPGIHRHSFMAAYSRVPAIRPIQCLSASIQCINIFVFARK